MKVSSALVLVAGAAAVSANPTVIKRAQPQGIDGAKNSCPRLSACTDHFVTVSHYQGTINWNTVKSNGVSFVYIKATEGTGKHTRLIFKISPKWYVFKAIPTQISPL